MSPLNGSSSFSSVSMGLCLFWNGMCGTKARTFSLFQDITIFQPQPSWLPLYGLFAMATTCRAFLALCCSGPSLKLGTSLKCSWAPEKHRHPEGIRVCWLASGSTGANIVPWQPRRPPQFWMHYALHRQLFKKGHLLTTVSLGVSSPGIYLAVLGTRT